MRSAHYLTKIINKEAFDRSGLIYGMGHAVYTLSDPRAVILKEYARSLSEEKGLTDRVCILCESGADRFRTADEPQKAA